MSVSILKANPDIKACDLLFVQANAFNMDYIKSIRGDFI